MQAAAGQTYCEREENEPLYIPANTSATTIVVNAERYGFYRQNYDENGWRKIIKRLNHNYEIFSPRTRNAIISDAFAAATIGRLDYTVVLDLIGYLERERQSTVDDNWRILCSRCS
ncbi:unnamed protein product [Haemonchus placei]|uniref:ERAP1_C domain-containing protein n=1 Tax=Haemonchus placei TaxID=6290 RepID=A0A158QLA4_HAEPC|nr:unnamed protein product [Haemonchus placei]